MQQGQGQFFITKVLRSVVNWKKFDSDTMSAESPILWEKASITRLSIKTNIEKLGTKAKTPTPRMERKQ